MRSAFCVSVILICAASIQCQDRKLKVFLSVDMEGIAGVVSADQLLPGSFEYERYRKFMTQEALAAIEGARQSGATEFVVTDSHGNEQNLLIEQLPSDVRIVRGSPRKLGMMAGLDSTFAAAMFIGYHASTHNEKGVRAHTFSSARFTGRHQWQACHRGRLECGDRRAIQRTSDLYIRR